MKILRPIFVLSILFFSGSLFSGCIIGADSNKITGEGPLETRIIEVTDFSGIEMSIPGDLVITQGNVEGMSISAQSNLYPFINIFVRGERLRIETNDDVSLDPTEPIAVLVDVRTLELLRFAGSGNVDMDSLTTTAFTIDLTGSADMQFDQLTTETFELSLAGSGTLNFAGTAIDQVVSIAGSGDMDGRNFESQTADVSISGSGSAIVNVSDALNASIAGSGSIRYWGNPTVESSVTGSGSIAPLGE